MTREKQIFANIFITVESVLELEIVKWFVYLEIGFSGLTM